MMNRYQIYSLMFVCFIIIDMFVEYQYNASVNIDELRKDFTINQLRSEIMISEENPSSARHFLVLEVGNQSSTKYSGAEYEVSLFSKSGDKIASKTIPDYFSIHEPKETTKVALHYRLKVADLINFDESKTEIILVDLDKTPLIHIPEISLYK